MNASSTLRRLSNVFRFVTIFAILFMNMGGVFPATIAQADANQSPMAEAGGPYAGTTSQSIILDGSASSDPDGDMLSYEWDINNDGQYDDATGVTAPAVFDQAGNYTVSLRVTDPLGLTATDTASVAVLPQAPLYDPKFTVWLNQNKVDGYGWPENTQITMAVSDPSGVLIERIETTGNAPELGTQAIRFQFGEDFTLLNGQTVTLSTGTYTRTHPIGNLLVTDISADGDTVSGTADSNSVVVVSNKWNSAIWRNETATVDGSWMADFKAVGDEPGEVIADIRPGEEYHVCQNGQEGSTCWYMPIPSPAINVRANDDRVEGWQWPLGKTITVTVDDPATPVDPDISRTAVAYEDTWSPGRGRFELNLSSMIDIQPGFEVTASAVGVTKSHIVTPLAFTDINTDQDIVTGVAASGSRVNIWACENSNCINRYIDADPTGNWTADFGHTGIEWYEQNTFNIVPGTWIDSSQGDDDGDQTMFGQSVPDPRIEVSYEHDWVNISGFTPNGQVTYTIYDYEGGHALFGPVTGPLDSHGNGWISSNLFHTDLIPGNVVTAENETTGEVISLVIRDVNLDYIGSDRAFGTAEPNTTIRLGVSETHDSWFGLDVNVDISGHWEIDLNAAGHPVNGYRYADARLCDAEGDCIIGQSAWIDAEISTDSFGVTNFSKNADVTMTVYDGPEGDVLYGPITQRTDGSGSTWVNLWNEGIDLLPGDYIVAYDQQLDFTKSLDVEPFDFVEMNAADDTVSGTAATGEWVDLHVESLFSNWGMDALTDQSGQWFRDYGAQNYDITDQMWANGWAVDGWGNRSHDHTTGLPGLEASLTDDWISGYNFSPDRQVRIRIYASDGSQLDDEILYASGNTRFSLDYWQHRVDLQPGMRVLVVDLETGKQAQLTLANLTFDGVDYDINTTWGRADQGVDVVVKASHLFDNYQITIPADNTGHWSADFAPLSVDLTSEWDLQARVYELDQDATVANAPRPPEVTASINEDWVNGNYWTADDSVSIRIFDGAGGALLAGPFTWYTDSHGSFQANLRNQSVDILPGNYITVTDGTTEAVKTILLPGLSIDYLDPETDVAGGSAPADTRLSLNFNNDQEGIQFDMFSESNGTWEADFKAYDFDLQSGSSGSVSILDSDGDTIQVNGRVPKPSFAVRPNWDGVEGWEWVLGATLSISIDNPDTIVDPDHTGNAKVRVCGYDPSRTCFDVSFGDRYDIKPGDTVTVTDGVTTKALVVDGYEIKAVNTVTDTVTGIAAPGQKINVWTCWQNKPCINREATTDQQGTWSENFSLAGDQNWEWETSDIQAGTWVDSSVYDEDGDQTMFGWNVPNPSLSANLTYNQVEGYTWPLGELIHLTIDDPSTDEPMDFSDSQTVVVADWNPNETLVRFSLGENGFTLKPGMTVTMTDGTTTRTHVVVDLTITEVNANIEKISGHGNPNQDVWVDIWCDNCPSRHVTASANGDWVADFSSPGDEDWENNTFDIQPGNTGQVRQQDMQGNSTNLTWYLYTYTLHAVPAQPEVHGHDWPASTPITLIIDTDTDPGNGKLYTATKTVDDDPWCGSPCFDLKDVFDLQVGQFVTMTDGMVSKTVQVSRLQITDVDRENNTISGIADPGSRVAVNIWSQEGKARYVTAGVDGKWIVDFSVFGDEDFEQFTTDLTYGDNGRAIQLNPDGTDDGTLEYWNVDWIAPDWIPLVSALTESSDLNHLTYTTDGWTLANLLYEPLFRSTGHENFIPAAATGYTLSSDGKTYTISLREDIFWSDGQPVTAQHFVDGFLRILTPDTGMDYYSLLYDIQGAREYHEGTTANPMDVRLVAVDEHTLQITLAHPAAHFPQVLAIAGMVPVRLDVVAQYGDSWAQPGNFVGNGPYRLLEKDNGHIILQKSTSFHEAADVAFEYIGFDIIADTNEQFNAYQEGDIDVVIDPPQGALTDPNYVSDQYASNLPGTIFLRLGVQDAPTNNLLVRQALAASIDRQSLLLNVLNMPWLQEATGVIPPSVPGYQGAEVGYAYDPLIAQQLLADAGYPGGEGLPPVHLYGRTSNKDMLEAVAGGWESMLGITVEVHLIDGNLTSTMHQCEDSPDCVLNVYRLGWILDYFDAYNMLSDFFHPDSGFPNGGWDNARYRELIQLIMAEQDPAQRILYLQEAEQILVESDAVVIPLYFNSRVSLIKPGLEPVYGLIPYFDMWNKVSTNRPPVTEAGPDQSTFIDTSVTLDASASSDLDGDILTYEWDLDQDGQYDDATGISTTVSFAQVGDHLLGLQVTDSGGLSSTDTMTVRVQAWSIKGFYQPVDMNGVYNLVKGGNTVPLKFEIFAGQTELTDVANVRSLTYAETTCSTNSVTDEIELTVTGGTTLRYDTLSGQYVYNWQTTKSSDKCYRVTMIMLDGTSLLAYFKLK